MPDHLLHNCLLHPLALVRGLPESAFTRDSKGRVTHIELGNGADIMFHAAAYDCIPANDRTFEAFNDGSMNEDLFTKAKNSEAYRRTEDESEDEILSASQRQVRKLVAEEKMKHESAAEEEEAKEVVVKEEKPKVAVKEEPPHFAPEDYGSDFGSDVSESLLDRSSDKEVDSCSSDEETDDGIIRVDDKFSQDLDILNSALARHMTDLPVSKPVAKSKNKVAAVVPKKENIAASASHKYAAATNNRVGGKSQKTKTAPTTNTKSTRRSARTPVPKKMH